LKCAAPQEPEGEEPSGSGLEKSPSIFPGVEQAVPSDWKEDPMLPMERIKLFQENINEC